MKYTITREFLEGNLKGITYTEETDVYLEPNKIYRGAWNNEKYIVREVIFNQ